MNSAEYYIGRQPDTFDIVISDDHNSNSSKLLASTKCVNSAVSQVQAGKLDNTTTHLIKTWKSTDGSSWYRKWSDGWIEQGGLSYSTSGTISFPVPFSNNNYTLSDSRVNNHQSMLWGISLSLNERSATSFKFTNESGSLFSWYACGY